MLKTSEIWKMKMWGASRSSSCGPNARVFRALSPRIEKQIETCCAVAAEIFQRDSTEYFDAYPSFVVPFRGDSLYVREPDQQAPGFFWLAPRSTMATSSKSNQRTGEQAWAKIGKVVSGPASNFSAKSTWILVCFLRRLELLSTQAVFILYCLHCSRRGLAAGPFH